LGEVDEYGKREEDMDKHGESWSIEQGKDKKYEKQDAFQGRWGALSTPQ
jgi:hypothetical protein